MCAEPRLKATLSAVTLIVVIVIAASAKAGVVRSIVPDWQSAKPFTAVVSASEANFVFAVPERTAWEWRLPETRNAGLEYAWTVTIQASADHRYALGFSLYNFPSLQPSHGDFRALLQAGGFGVAEVHPGYNQVDRTLKLEAVASTNRLVITVSDPQTFRRLFLERPTEVTFSIQLPGQGRTSRTVPIVY